MTPLGCKVFTHDEDLGIHYRVSGDGSPVVFIHGVASSLCGWSNLLPSVADAGFRAYALDLPGHGESIKPEDPALYHVEAIFETVSAWITRLDLPEKPLLVGHSLGGYLSLLYAIRFPERTRGLVLINPLYSREQLAPILRWARKKPDIGMKAMRILPEWLFRLVLGLDPSRQGSFSPEMRRQIANDYKRASPQILNITRDFPDLSEWLGEVCVPATVIWGEQDYTLQPFSFHRLVQDLPNATAHPIPGSGHQPHIGYPEVVSRLALKFAGQILNTTADL
jgi:pimeloyl-ACP methyl ester carboxylesterase